MLNNAMMMEHGGAGMAAGSPMASGASTTSTTPMSYMLTGGTLKPHVGHKVEITGMMKPMAKDAMKKDAMAKDGMAKGDMKKDEMMKKDAMGMAGTLEVKAVKMVAASCS
ncbi:MAG: pentapeptide MXKDX repeat protein [Acidobacteriota bacterium]